MSSKDCAIRREWVAPKFQEIRMALWFVYFFYLIDGSSELFDILIVGSYVEIDFPFLLQIPVNNGWRKRHEICFFYFFTIKSKADGIVL